MYAGWSFQIGFNILLLLCWRCICSSMIHGQLIYSSFLRWETKTLFWTKEETKILLRIALQIRRFMIDASFFFALVQHTIIRMPNTPHTESKIKCKLNHLILVVYNSKLLVRFTIDSNLNKQSNEENDGICRVNWPYDVKRPLVNYEKCLCISLA